MLEDFLNYRLGVYIGQRSVNDPLMQELINYLNKEHIPINGLKNASTRYRSYEEFFQDSYAWEIFTYDPYYGVDMIRGHAAEDFENIRNNVSVVSIEEFIGLKDETIKEISYEENELIKLFE